MFEIAPDLELETSIIQDDAKKRGRPFRDFVERLRSALWARRTRKLAKKSFGKLDVAFLPERSTVDSEALKRSRPSKYIRVIKPKGTETKKARVRAMERIARFGDSPEGVWHGSQNLVAIAATKVGTSEEDYRSPVWALLSANDMPVPAELMAEARRAALRIGFCWMNRNDADTLMVLCGPGFPACPGDEDSIERGAKAVAENGSLDAVFLLAMAAWQAVENLRLGVGQIYLDALDSCCERYDREADAGPFSGMIRGLMIERLVRRKWRPIHPRYWPYETLLRGAKKRDKARTPGLYGTRTLPFGPFAVNALRPNRMVPIVRRDRRIAAAQALEEEAVHESTCLGWDRHLIGNYPVLKAMAQLWPTTQDWRYFREPDGRWSGPIDLTGTEGQSF